MSDDLQDALDRAAAAPRLLVALDFDGTLAPFTEDPADSRPLPAAREALDALAQLPHTTVAVISGRPLEFLRTVVDPDSRMVLSGSHGSRTAASAARAPAIASSRSLPMTPSSSRVAKSQ